METPLDKVEPYGMFKTALMSASISVVSSLTFLIANSRTELQQEQPQLYDTLTKILNPEEQSIVQGVIHQADINAMAAAAETNGGAH